MFYLRFARLVKAGPCDYIEERNVGGERHLTKPKSGTVITSRSECSTSNLVSLGSSKRDRDYMGEGNVGEERHLTKPKNGTVIISRSQCSNLVLLCSSKWDRDYIEERMF